MASIVARPDAADLVLQTFGCALHPELLCHHKIARSALPDMKLDVRLIAAGHALTVNMESQSLTEVISDVHDPFPVRGRLLIQKLRGNRTKTVAFESGLRYDVSYTLERQSLAVFIRQTEELIEDESNASLFASFPGSNRFSPGPISLVRIEAYRHSFVMHAYHTFPEQLTIVKTQTLVEVV